MPIYEYECKQCGHRLEAIQKFNEATLTRCPVCGKNTLQKCISLPSFQLKGSGWYETDFKNKGKQATDKKEATSSSVSKPTESKDKNSGEKTT